jgi:hypothetical protein
MTNNEAPRLERMPKNGAGKTGVMVETVCKPMILRQSFVQMKGSQCVNCLN